MNFSEDLLVSLNSEMELLLESYSTVPVSRLLQELNISTGSKNQFNALTRRLIAYKNMSVLSQLEQNEGLTLKCIKLDKYGKLKESVSLPTFNYCDLAEEEWKNSSLRKIFNDKVFAFTVYQSVGKDNFLKKIVLWKMPAEVLDEGVRKTWEQTRECLRKGRIVKFIDDYGRYHSFFPSSTESPYVHVRPHAQNRNDTYKLPVADELTGLIEYPKHSFWLNRAYVLKIISKEGM